MRSRRGATSVDGDLDVAVGAVLEPDRHREAGAELAVGLTLGGAGADRPPADRVGDVLRRDRIEELAADRQAGVEHLQQQLAGDPQAGVDVAGVVEVGIVDQPLPPGRRPRLLEVDPHHDQQLAVQLARLGAEPPGVVECRFRVVDAAGADHDHQPLVLAAEDVDHFLAPFHHLGFARLAERQLLQQRRRWAQLHHFRDPLFADPVSFGSLHTDEHIAVAFLHSR